MLVFPLNKVNKFVVTIFLHLSNYIVRDENKSGRLTGIYSLIYVKSDQTNFFFF